MKNTSPQPPVPKPRGSSLTRIVSWSQQLLCEVLEHGDLAVDLTAGTGQDTHILAEAVGTEGQVVAFDLQAEAVDPISAELIQLAGDEVQQAREQIARTSQLAKIVLAVAVVAAVALAGVIALSLIHI